MERDTLGKEAMDGEGEGIGRESGDRRRGRGGAWTGGRNYLEEGDLMGREERPQRVETNQGRAGKGSCGGKEGRMGEEQLEYECKTEAGEGEGWDGRAGLPAGGGLTGNGQGREGKVGRRTG